MINKYYGVIFLVLIMAFAATSCSGAVTSTSVGGASISTGLEIQDNLTVRSAKNEFAAGEVFYISFDNNASFGTGSITMRVEDTETREIIGEADYNVEPEWTIMATDGSLNEPGKYKIIFIVDGKVRASQSVVIR